MLCFRSLTVRTFLSLADTCTCTAQHYYACSFNSDEAGRKAKKMLQQVERFVAAEEPPGNESSSGPRPGQGQHASAAQTGPPKNWQRRQTIRGATPSSSNASNDREVQRPSIPVSRGGRPPPLPSRFLMVGVPPRVLDRQTDDKPGSEHSDGERERERGQTCLCSCFVSQENQEVCVCAQDEAMAARNRREMLTRQAPVVNLLLLEQPVEQVSVVHFQVQAGGITTKTGKRNALLPSLK